ncbi:MAG: PDZ domain-containing protein [Chthoniobacteraceae bacterium]
MRAFSLVTLLLVSVASLCVAKETPAKAVAPAKTVATADKPVQVVRVNVTNQAYDFIRPWSKKAPFSRHALGSVLANNRVLVTAELVANANYVELEKAASGEKTVASVEVVDYEANLAILKPVDDKFLNGIKPLELTEAHVGDHVSAWQLEDTGALLGTAGLVTNVEVSRYPIDDTALLIYQITSSLQYRDSSFTVPVVKDNKLIGILMRYDARTQNVDLIPTPVIQHFLTDAAKKEYRGFPRTGVAFAPMRDPQLRRYVGLKSDETGGVYVTDVLRHGPGDKAGLQVGDVLLAIGDKAIDQDGNYADPQYGKIALSNFISTDNFDGDVVKFKILRKGVQSVVDVTLSHRPVEDYVIEPYTIGRPPKYIVLGGLVLQELTGQYLKEWGAEWYKKAPQKFVYMDQFQSELFPEGHRKIVFLSQVLPSPATIGYEDLNSLVISKINDIPLNSIADVDRAVKNPVNGFHKIEFEESPTVIYLDAKQVEAESAQLMKSYGLPTLKRIE